tara:strand:- start:498 stop:986 length:489 start_codon:yes stop_codon:yes gene_type:complete
MNEDQIYISSKKWFKKNNFLILAGQPPNGSDHIPVIEIKESLNIDKGSKGSYKPDLVIQKNNSIVIVECKPIFDKNDHNKLSNVINSDDRKKVFFNELVQRKLINKSIQNISYDDFATNLRYCMSFSGKGKNSDKIAFLNIFDGNGNAELIQPKDIFYNIVI